MSMLFGIRCCLGYDAVWDTMLFGIRCCLGYDTDDEIDRTIRMNVASQLLVACAGYSVPRKVALSADTYDLLMSCDTYIFIRVD